MFLKDRDTKRNRHAGFRHVNWRKLAGSMNRSGQAEMPEARLMPGYGRIATLITPSFRWPKS
jgi:hypothetical protein